MTSDALVGDVDVDAHVAKRVAFAFESVDEISTILTSDAHAPDVVQSALAALRDFALSAGSADSEACRLLMSTATTSALATPRKLAVALLANRFFHSTFLRPRYLCFSNF
jgi:hypothetical protein